MGASLAIYSTETELTKPTLIFIRVGFGKTGANSAHSLKGYRYLFLERTQHYSSSVYQEFNLFVEEIQTFWLGIWLMNMIKLDPQIMMSGNCQFSSIGFDRLCQLSQSSFCQIKLSIILGWAAKLGKNTLLSLWRWPTVRLTRNGKMVTASVRREELLNCQFLAPSGARGVTMFVRPFVWS